ncbi:Cleavage and polyadenylation specificity factor subunit 1 [Chelonia mydas]|uniref:Cleavage and polyadenylation specificity factor subunit 1 n=1 Tax=Chelonia mydas TaxID=8469 RepID=M7AVW5_CHEMY|nr:Cleavage and polyadenylation specificity factor subunit 1 [Chelonia mydas]
MYAVYRQAHPPTGVEFSMYCNFFSNTERNLVVAGTSQLYVYRLNHDSEPSTKGDRNTEGKGHKEKLELVASFSFFGNVMSMASVQLAGAKRDALLLSFKDAKDGFVQNVHIPKVRVDPDGRCAVMLIYGTRLVVLPFRRETLTDEHEGVMGEGQKSSFLPSYIIDGRERDEKLLNIIDMQFLYGYYEPTLLILFEPNQTWPGMAPAVRGTQSPGARYGGAEGGAKGAPFPPRLLSDHLLSLELRRGVVIFAVNSLLYLNQSVPPYGVSLNCLTTGTTVFPLRIQDGVKVTLDCAQAAFISYDKMVISLKGGEIYVLTLITDGMRSVRSFHFDKAAASVLTTCGNWATETLSRQMGAMGLGAMLPRWLLGFQPRPGGDQSLTVSASLRVTQYTEKLQEPPVNVVKDPADKQEEPPVKKKRSESSGNWAGGKSAPQDEVDEIEVYGSEAQSGTQLATYSFEVCDSILNIGPCANAAMGEPAFLSEEKSIRPQVVTTFELPGCYDMWTVISPQKKEEDESAKGETAEKEPSHPEPEDDGKRHGFLILSREDSTMILQTGQEIMELDTSGFATQGPTVFAGNIGENRYIVHVPHPEPGQLGPSAVAVNQLHFIPVDLGSPIVHCAVADPYVVIMSAEGQVTMFVLKSDTYGGRTHRLTLQKPQLHHQSKVIALCVYRDVRGMFTTESRTTSSRDELSLRSHSEVETVIQDISNTVDDEEEMLYGDSSSLFSPTKEEPRRSSLPLSDRDPHQYKVEPTHWCVLVRENGAMEIYQLPDWRLVFLVKNFPMGQRVLVDSSFGQPAAQGDAKKEEVTRQGEMPLVKEVLLVALGNRQSRPYLLVHVDQELLIYEAFSHDSQLGQSNLKVRFKKVFICGPSPHWLLVTARGALRLHPMTIDGLIESFAPFHNVNCPKGFLYFNRQGELRISVLPAYLSYDAPWPVRKIPLRCTTHYVAYHVESKVYAVATSVVNPCTRIPRMTGEEKEFESIERDERYIHPQQEAFSIQLISPVSWETIPNTRIELEEWEHVTCMKTVSLKSEETVSGLKGYIAAGTCLMQGEEVTCRGRILIMDIIEVVPEPGQPLTKNKFKVLYEKEQKGPVTALCHCHGYLVSAIGQKIFLWSLKDNDLTGMAFIDTQLYIHQMISVKNFILAADVMKSISLLRYQEESKTLSLVSRDAKPLEVYSVDFMVDTDQLGFLVSDRDRNLMVYMYLPEAKESFGGMRLLRRADFHVGAHVNTFWRTPCRWATDGVTKKSSAWESKHITWFATLDGGIGLLLPMLEKTYRRLLMLQNALTTMLPHHAGLNPRAFRMLHVDRRTLQNAVRNILDGELLTRYLYLSAMERNELAKKIGTTPDIILEDLLEIDRVTAHF